MLLWPFNIKSYLDCSVLHTSIRRLNQYISHWDYFCLVMPFMMLVILLLIQVSPWLKRMAPESNLDAMWLKEPAKTNPCAKQQCTFGEPDAFSFFGVFKTVLHGFTETSVLSYRLGEKHVQRQTCLKDQAFCFLSRLNSFVLDWKLLISSEVSVFPLSLGFLYSLL